MVHNVVTIDRRPTQLTFFSRDTEAWLQSQVSESYQN
jgi:hypothetical protein